MLSINTNTSSLIAQNSMKSSTDKLNQAIERMTTGAKINHAKDNAANYSIATNMTTKINAYQVAEDNCAMGLDLVQTASNTIATIQNRATRLQALSIQARNATYGTSSLSAINSEASAITAEIIRLYSTAKFNGVSIFNHTELVVDPDFTDLTPRYNGFIADPVTYSDAEIQSMTKVADVDSYSSGQTYSISTTEELVKLANYVNSGGDTTGATFVLGANIDLGTIDNWTPIGNSDTIKFNGTFDGNGHVIKNLTINKPSMLNVGLFGYAGGLLKNVGIENCNVKGSRDTGGLVGYLANGSEVTNCYTTGSVDGYIVGGVVGYVQSSKVTNCYSTVEIYSTCHTVGGLVGMLNGGGTISDSFATGDVRCSDSSVGGLAGRASGEILNCYATGNVTGIDEIGGLVGSNGANITDSYATGKVSGNKNVGGLVGYGSGYTLTNCASYSIVSGADADSIGSFIGSAVLVDSSGTYEDQTLKILGCEAVQQDMKSIGGIYSRDFTSSGIPSGLVADYDMTAMLAGIMDVILTPVETTLQVGINGNDFCQLTFDTNFSFDISAITTDIASDMALNQITDFLNLLSNKQTELGAVENRLNSALESIAIAYDNLVSSRSTIQDADMAEVSSEYIKMQILQQASATLMATANQSSSIALQLL